MTKSDQLLYSVILLFIGGILFIPFLGSVHLFDWDEINFAESAREMMVTGNYSQVQINFNPFWEKPPLFIWLQVLSMKLFGINEFAARFPNAIFGILTLWVIFSFAKKLFKGHVAHWWVLSYLGSITPHLYFKTGLIDPVFNFFIFLSILEFFKALKNHHVSYNPNQNFFLAGIYTGIAILCKGPVALLVGLLVLFAMVFAKRMVWFFRIQHLFFYLFSTLLVCCIWFLPETIKNGPYFLIEFIQYQIGLFSQNIAGHQQPFYYHALVLFFGCFPISIFAIAAWKKNEFYTYPENVFRLTMLCLFWVVLILFSIVKTKIVHYSSLCWLPLTFLSAYGIESICNSIFKFKLKYILLTLLIGLIIASASIALPLVMMFHKATIIPYIKDEFAVMNINANVKWHFTDLTPGIILSLSLITFVVMLIKKVNKTTVFGVFLIGMVVFISLSSILLVPKIEAHTQGGIIQFYQSKSKENCYFHNAGFKTYAIYFYANTLPLKSKDGLYKVRSVFLKSKGAPNYLALNEQQRSELDGAEKHWLINDAKLDKDAYFVVKANNTQELGLNPELKIVYNKDGFIVFKRSKKP